MANNANSPQYTLNEKDWKTAAISAIVWLAPVCLLYITAILGILQIEGHVFSWNDFIPSKFTQGGIAIYLLNRVYDLILKFTDDNKKVK